MEQQINSIFLNGLEENDNKQPPTIREIDRMIANQIKLWENRVYFKKKFKPETTKKYENKLSTIFNTINDGNFLLAGSNTEASVYKIGHWLVEQGLNNDAISFIDGETFKVYVDLSYRATNQKRALIDKFIKANESNIRDKVIFIPKIESEWDIEYVIYFINSMRLYGCYGMIFYSPENVDNSFSEIIFGKTSFVGIQFPEDRYKKKLDIEDDNI